MTSAIDIYEQFGQFSQVGDIFDQLVGVPNTHDIQPNYCQDCIIPMILAGSDYQCSQCGRVRHFAGDICKDRDDVTSSSIRIASGINKGRFYNISGDYARTQMKTIVDQLLQKHSAFTGMAFPLNILHAAATQYNRIQKYITEDDVDESGIVRGQKKFVRRGNIKDEILAALIYFEGIRINVVRKKRDIAIFMKLPTYGFSRGEDILRNLQAESKIDIPVDDEPIEGYVDRYMDGLNLDNPNYSRFIIDLVQESETRKIGMNSQLSSKIVGAIWILIDKCHLGISYAKLEKATDNTKRNTFSKFYNIVINNIGAFAHIFVKYGIPYK